MLNMFVLLFRLNLIVGWVNLRMRSRRERLCGVVRSLVMVLMRLRPVLLRGRLGDGCRLWPIGLWLR